MSFNPCSDSQHTFCILLRTETMSPREHNSDRQITDLGTGFSSPFLSTGRLGWLMDIPRITSKEL